jgi:hypothetical protein
VELTYFVKGPHRQRGSCYRESVKGLMGVTKPHQLLYCSRNPSEYRQDGRQRDDCLQSSLTIEVCYGKGVEPPCGSFDFVQALSSEGDSTVDWKGRC